jgi:hypothetical protein
MRGLHLRLAELVHEPAAEGLDLRHLRLPKRPLTAGQFRRAQDDDRLLREGHDLDVRIGKNGPVADVEIGLPGR